jgi:hypothetical protein
MWMWSGEIAPHNYYITRLAYLSYQIARTLCHSSGQYLVTIFRTPDQVTLQIVDRVRASSVFRHLPHCRGVERAAQSGPPET